ncbi:hypothetical protein HBI55_076530 [Parastagonospora nodorum]|nr:hypothetical protein HBH51_094520 [Parastagonospora nodorum]KAH4009728.1 hypothetical protein HBI09_234550 [Parastagonospora nodorum]KAH4172262.1 hypothetical protein HBH43_087060 [Parastagonospora nodorum]KAH4187574.1 hypothetical protein HBH42_159560 [Parastagonospora nodorum]KAH4604690.1 hypothetical protein HBH82_130900 [Parastagonospora nodorum]
MNATNYDKQKGIVSIGPGMRSGHIYDEIMDDGIVVTAGRVAPVGAAGFIAGGGISYHWPSHGWGCDNVINFEMILANGTILNANEQQNRDLWVAQRGSSGNFGLITRYDMRAISYANPKVPVIWAGAIEYDWSAKREFVDRWVAFTKRHALDMNSSSMFQFQYDTTSNKWQLITIVSNTANIANASTLEPIISMDKQLSNDLRSDTMGNFTREFFADVNDKYHIWFTSTYTVDPDFILYTQEQHQLLVQQLRVALPNGTQFTSLTTHHAITPTAVSHSNGNNVLGLEKRVANNTVGHMFLIWVQLKTAQDEVIALPIVQAWHKKLEKEGNRRRINWNWEYLNYAHGLQDPVRTYGEENVGKLKKASKKYDPEGVFQRLRGSGFKIPVN